MSGIIKFIKKNLQTISGNTVAKISGITRINEISTFILHAHFFFLIRKCNKGTDIEC